MSLFVGTNLEVIKEVNPQSGEWQNVVIGKSLKTKSAKDKEGICGMCWKNQSQNSILYVTKNRRIRQYNVGDKAARDLFQCSPDTAIGATAICSLESSEKIVVGTEDGSVYLSNAKEVETHWSTGSNLHVMRPCEKRNHLLTGGKENDLKLWDLAHLSKDATPIFTAKNVRPNELCLRRPIWVTDANFLPDGRRVIVTTGHADVRIYDPSTPQRRPVFECSWGEKPITCMALPAEREEQLYVGNTTGQAALLDLRRRGAVGGHFKKIAGSVRSLACGKGGDPVLYSCSSDRFLRVHHLETRELLKEIYLKLKPHVLLVQDNVKFFEQTDDVWDSMIPIKYGTKRKIKE